MRSFMVDQVYHMDQSAVLVVTWTLYVSSGAFHCQRCPHNILYSDLDFQNESRNKNLKVRISSHFITKGWGGWGDGGMGGWGRMGGWGDGGRGCTDKKHVTLAVK